MQGSAWPLWKDPRNIYKWDRTRYGAEGRAYLRNDGVTGFSVVYLFTMRLVSESRTLQLDEAANANMVLDIGVTAAWEEAQEGRLATRARKIAWELAKQGVGVYAGKFLPIDLAEARPANFMSDSDSEDVGDKDAKYEAKSKVWDCKTDPNNRDHYGRLLVHCPDLIKHMVGVGAAHLFAIGDTPDPAAVQAASLAYLKAAESAVEDMGRDGRVILVAEAVLAGAAEDATPELEARIAEKLKAGERQ